VTGSAIRDGVLVPVGIIALALLTVYNAAMLGGLGPLDPVVASRLAIGLWVVAPVAGGVLIRRQGGSADVSAATVLGLLVAAAVAFLYLTAAGTAALTTACAGFPHGMALFVPGCVVVGLLAGLGMATGVLATARMTARGWWVPGILVGAGANFALGIAAYALVYSVVVCLHP
jgi:hypothetical protein